MALADEEYRQDSRKARCDGSLDCFRYDSVELPSGDILEPPHGAESLPWALIPDPEPPETSGASEFSRTPAAQEPTLLLKLPSSTIPAEVLSQDVVPLLP